MHCICTAFWIVDCCYLESDYVVWVHVHCMFTSGINEVARTPCSGSLVGFLPLPARVIIMVSRGNEVTPYVLPWGDNQVGNCQECQPIHLVAFMCCFLSFPLPRLLSGASLNRLSPFFSSLSLSLLPPSLCPSLMLSSFSLPLSLSPSYHLVRDSLSLRYSFKTSEHFALLWESISIQITPAYIHYSSDGTHSSVSTSLLL